MRVLHAASELFPLVKTGGLADVAAALPPALADQGVDARILVPGYPSVMAEAGDMRPMLTDGDLFGGGKARLLAGRLDRVGVQAYVLDCPGLFDRPGNLYTGPDGRDWPDNHRRFAALGWAAARLGGAFGPAGDPGWRPDIVHGHDWQAGLAPAYLALGGAGTRTVMTIHNLAYQGWFPAAVLPELGLPPDSFRIDGVEYYGGVGFLKAGLHYADRLTTVSRTYAREVQAPEHGAGLDGLLRVRAGDLVGIVNGADYAVWNPETDPALPRSYSACTPDGKADAKATLQARMGLPVEPHAPLFGVVSRLTWHKGLDLLLGALPSLVDRGGQLVLLGSGERGLEDGFEAAAAAWPHRVAVRLGYDEVLAHLIEGGADVILVPSRTEPCGLTQIYALRYGSLPLVRRTGGLADTVVDATPENVAAGTATGFVFDDATVEALSAAIASACTLWQDHDLWRALQQTAMHADFSWARAAREYAALYSELIRS
ncbi:MAG TPA: glycogen synthase GlgA [Alphaproteobacteria bacterium]|nr:glycogen synthase GlgA [Alphaproteobacteria bacterium]